MKKNLVFVISLLIIGSLLLAACGSTPTPAPQQAAPVQEQAPVKAEAPAAESAEITVMMWGDPAELAVWEQVVNDFQTTNPNIKVKVDVSDWDSYWNKLQTLFAAGTPPDVFAMDAPYYPDWASRGVLLNLQPYIDNSPGFLDGLYAGPLATYKRDDGYYGLPRDFQTIVLYYNKDLFDAAGMDYPTNEWTMDDLRAAAKELTLDTNGDGKTDQWGLGVDLWDMELFWGPAVWGFGGEVISDDRTQTLIGEEKARDAFHFISEMMLEDKSIVDPDTQAQYGDDAFAAGVAAMTTIGHWAVPTYKEAELNFDVAAMPAGPAKHSTTVNSAGFVVAKDTANPDASWEFIKFALGPGGQTRLTELGFAIPVAKAVAESPVYLEQDTAINHQVFLDATEYAHTKPAFRGYDEWAGIVGDTLGLVWIGDMTIDEALDEIVPAADEVLAENQ